MLCPDFSIDKKRKMRSKLKCCAVILWEKGMLTLQLYCSCFDPYAQDLACRRCRTASINALAMWVAGLSKIGSKCYKVYCPLSFGVWGGRIDTRPHQSFFSIFLRACECYRLEFPDLIEGMALKYIYHVPPSLPAHRIVLSRLLLRRAQK